MATDTDQHQQRYQQQYQHITRTKGVPLRRSSEDVRAPRSPGRTQQGVGHGDGALLLLPHAEPRSVAITFVILVAVGMRGAGSWTYDWSSTVMRPPESSAYDFISAAIQSRAAPMPRQPRRP